MVSRTVSTWALRAAASVSARTAAITAMMTPMCLFVSENSSSSPSAIGWCLYAVGNVAHAPTAIERAADNPGAFSRLHVRKLNAAESQKALPPVGAGARRNATLAADNVGLRLRPLCGHLR